MKGLKAIKRFFKRKQATASVNVTTNDHVAELPAFIASSPEPLRSMLVRRAGANKYDSYAPLRSGMFAIQPQLPQRPISAASDYARMVELIVDQNAQEEDQEKSLSAILEGDEEESVAEARKITPIIDSFSTGLSMSSSVNLSAPPAATSSKRHGSLSLARRSTRSEQQNSSHLDSNSYDEDAARWGQSIYARRVSRKTSEHHSHNEEDSKQVIGTRVDSSHANWIIAYDMLTGIRHSVSRVNAKNDRDLVPADFTAKHKITHDVTGTELTPSAKYDFKFKDYAPWVFRHLRNNFRIDSAEYLISLTKEYILTELGTPGKSKSIFFFSRDFKYIIKTISKQESKVLQQILPAYTRHVTENPNTLISQYYGLHRVKLPYGRKIHFVVMNNIFPPHRDIHARYDLKGSTVGRLLTDSELEAKGPSEATRKDGNWLNEKQKLEFGSDKKFCFQTQMTKDVELLHELGVMDYSLLIGIHDLQKGNSHNLRARNLKVFRPEHQTEDSIANSEASPPFHRTPSKLESEQRAQDLREKVNSRKPVPLDLNALTSMSADAYNKPGFYFYADDGGFKSSDEKNEPTESIYYLGIIDCLTRWSVKKKVEHFYKGLSDDRAKISPINPADYAKRFLEFTINQCRS